MKTLNSIAGICLLIYVIFSVITDFGGYIYRSLFESDAKTYVRCLAASEHLTQNRARAILSKKLYNENVRPDKIIKWGSDYQASLSGKSDMFAIYKLVKTYNSSACLKAHEQPKIKSLPFTYYLLYIFA